MINYKQIEVEFFRAKSMGELDVVTKITGEIRKKLRDLSVRCDFYDEKYGARLDVRDQLTPKTPVQLKYESLLLEYNEANRLSRILAAYA